MKAIQIKWKTVFILCIFYTSFSHAQLADFTLQVTPITESCTANGRLNMVVTNTTPLATIIYTIYKLPNITVPIAVLSANTLTGLVSGNYRVIATQLLGELTNSQQQEVVITDTIIDLNYYLSGLPEICGNDGKITVTVTNSVAVSYEIFSGPVIRPLQTSDVFNNLPQGTYSVRVFDNCGEGVVQSIVIGFSTSVITFRFQGDYSINCNEINSINYLETQNGGIIVYPIVVKYILTLPSGAQQNYTQIITSGSLNSQPILQIFPLFYGQTCTYQISVTDVCGHTYSDPTNHYISPIALASMGGTPIGCSGMWLTIGLNDFAIAPFTVNFLSSPVGFNPSAFNTSHPGPFFTDNIVYQSTLPVPNGNYTAQVIDACGHVMEISTTVVPQVRPNFTVAYQAPGCQVGLGSLWLHNTTGYGIFSASVLSAPAGFPQTLPYVIFGSATESTDVFLGSLAEGDYVFRTTDVCGVVAIVPVTVIGYHVISNNIAIVPGCNSFGINLQHNSTLSSVQFLLQKFNQVTGQWTHPITNYDQCISCPPNGNNALVLQNNTINYNITATGQFRVVKVFSSYKTPTTNTSQDNQLNCLEELYIFEYTGVPKIDDVYSFACENSLYDAIVIAQGYAPLKYRITSKNGQPFFVNNNFSNIFLGLEPTVYNFQIEDACGNILNSLFDISNPSLFPIQATTFCEGQSGSLAVPSFTFLNYEWRKGNDPTIISTSSTLNFLSFNATTNNGIYHVRVFYTGNPNSCIDFVVDYTININSSTPQAGTGQTIQYCGEQGVIDLFSLLAGNYDSNGSWQDLSNSGFLTNNLLDTTTIVSGDFQFKYTVLGSCNTSDQSTVNVLIKALPETPIASVEDVICNTRQLNLQATSIPFGSYLWTGPNGFSSSEQNPVLSNISELVNGTYTVKGYTNDCDSGLSSVDVVVNPLPEFTLKAGCMGNQFVVTAVPTNNSYDSLTASYIWTGPEGFSSIQNPIQITNLPTGLYEVTVVNSFGCSTQNAIQISGTHCFIPNVITPNNDDFNQELNLSGLLVDKLEVYSRWGRLVYQQNNYTNQWHGQNMHDQQLPDSTYYYIIYLRSGEEKQGWIFVAEP